MHSARGDVRTKNIIVFVVQHAILGIPDKPVTAYYPRRTRTFETICGSLEFCRYSAPYIYSYGSYKCTKARPWDRFKNAVHTHTYDGACKLHEKYGRQGQNSPVPSPLRALRVLELPQEDRLFA